MITVLGFLAHYWLFTTCTLACLWALSVHFLRRTKTGPVGRELARREDKRTAEYRDAVAGESAELQSDDGCPGEPVVP